MKRQKTIFYLLMLLPLPATALSLLFLPDQIPAHYGADNQVTRWGSKYETLLLPLLVILFGVFMRWISRLAARQEKTGSNNERICLLAGIFSLLLFDAMTGYFLYTAFHKVENLSAVPVDLSQLIFTLVGIALMAIGNVMPKVRMNAVMGLRTGWSMKNETTWKKSQRFGGISLMVTGGLIILACCFTKGNACFLWAMGILLLSLPVDVYYTYRVAKKYGSGREN